MLMKFMMVLDNLSNFQRQGSGWVFASIVRLEIHTVNYKPLRESSYIPLPKQLMSKKAIINLKNEDNECFKWAVTTAVHPGDHNAERITKELREQAETLNWEGINFPMPLKDITKFEKQNHGISVNVFGYEGGIYPLRISEHSEGTIHVDLFLIANEEGMQHYCWIKSMSRLLNSQISKDGHKQQYCRTCLNPFRSEDSLKEHVEYCSNNDAVRVVYPEKGSVKSILKFDNISRFMRVPFVVYVDFEAFIGLENGI